MSTPNIRFAQAQTHSKWLDFVQENFALQSDFVFWLREMGALYLNHKRWLPGENELLKKGDIVRVHIKPRRYPLDLLQSSTAQVQEHPDWVLLWKPSGVPSHETLDNLHENAKAWLQKQLQEKLWSLNRLDVATRGWLLLARSREFARAFNDEMLAGRVRKFYETLSPLPVRELGEWTHYMKKTLRAPKEVSLSSDGGFDLQCRLAILEQRTVSPNTVWSRLDLLTGRTHQIRAQFAFEKAPILGDVMYGSDFQNPKPYESLALSCEDFGFQTEGKTRFFSRPRTIPELPEEWLTKSAL